MAALHDEVGRRLRAALRAGDRSAVAALRLASAAIANASAVDPAGVPAGVTEVPRAVLDEDDERRIVATERDDLEASASEIASHGGGEAAAALRAKAAVLRDLLAGA